MEGLTRVVLSWRTFLRAIAAGGVSVVLVAALTACTSAAPSPAPTTPAPAAAPTKAAEPTKAPEPTKASVTSQPSAATAAPAKKVDFPQKGKAITMIVPYAAGGSTDVGGRLLAGQLEKELGTPVEVLNKAGAAGQVGITELALSKPDGYTFGYTSFPPAIAIYLDPDRKAAYSRKDLQPLAMHVFDPAVVAVANTSPYKTMKDLIDDVKAKPETVKIATTGIQSDDHFAVLQLERTTGAKFAIVHFADGAAPAMAAMLGGHIDVFQGNIGDVVGPVKSGQVRVLGIEDKEESKFLPGVKTAEAQGYKVYSAAPRGLSVPGGTPTEIVNILSGAIKKVMDSPEHKSKMDEAGLTLRYMDPKQYDAYWTETETQLKELLPLAKQ